MQTRRVIRIERFRFNILKNTPLRETRHFSRGRPRTAFHEHNARYPSMNFPQRQQCEISNISSSSCHPTRARGINHNRRQLYYIIPARPSDRAYKTYNNHILQHIYDCRYIAYIYIALNIIYTYMHLYVYGRN